MNTGEAPCHDRTSPATRRWDPGSWESVPGYDIRRAIAGSVGNFWSDRSYGEIYPALREAGAGGVGAAQGSSTCLVKLPGTLDTMTDACNRELERWLEQPGELDVYRVEEALIKALLRRAGS